MSTIDGLFDLIEFPIKFAPLKLDIVITNNIRLIFIIFMIPFLVSIFKPPKRF